MRFIFGDDWNDAPLHITLISGIDVISLESEGPWIFVYSYSPYTRMY